jgi:hypothetical protein
MGRIEPRHAGANLLISIAIPGIRFIAGLWLC